MRTPILSSEETRELEFILWQNDLSVLSEVIDKVGLALANAILKDLTIYQSWPLKAQILVLCGKGHNTADALSAVKHIAAKYPLIEVTLLRCCPEEAVSPVVDDLYAALKQNEVIKSVVSLTPNNLEAVDLLLKKHFHLTIDGCFGLNFRPPLPLGLCEVFKVINDNRWGVKVAIDVPSGLCEGVFEGAFRADFTYQTGFLKTIGLRREHAIWLGRLRFLDLGFYNELSPYLEDRGGIHDWGLGESELITLSQLRFAGAHKYHQGAVVIVAGSEAFGGASLLAVKGALYSGVGLVHAFVPNKLIASFTAVCPEVIWHPLPMQEACIDGQHLVSSILSIKGLQSVVVGPGLEGYAAFHTLLDVLGTSIHCPIIWDAACLKPYLVPVLKKRKKMRYHSVLTPHEGEFLSLTQSSVIGDGLLKAYAAEWGSIICLKGWVSQVTDGHDRYFILAGNPILARGGSGDILAGLLGGMICENTQASLLLQVSQGVLWHAVASDLWAREKGERAVALSEFFQYLQFALRISES